MVVERVELHELRFVWIHGQPLPRQLLGVAHDLFELPLGLGVAPAGQAHGHEGHGAHQHGGDEHSQRDLLERPNRSNRAEALAEHDRDQAQRERDHCRHARAPQVAVRGGRRARRGRPARATWLP